MKRNSTGPVEEMPEKNEVDEFWRGLWEVPTQHNTQANWLKALKSEMNPNLETKDYQITDEIFDKVLYKMANDKPGRDLTTALWIKRLKSTKTEMKELLTGTFELKNEIPDWLVLSKTILISKNNETRKAENYRPIALQNCMYKLYTGILAEFITDHCEINNIITLEQGEGKSGSWGCIDQLINNMIYEEVTQHWRNLTTVWLDYRKAFDSVPHSWIIEALKLSGIPNIVIRNIEMLMRKWRTKMYIHGINQSFETDVINYFKGILQGDTLSLILFVLYYTIS